MRTHEHLGARRQRPTGRRPARTIAGAAVLVGALLAPPLASATPAVPGPADVAMADSAGSADVDPGVHATLAEHGLAQVVLRAAPGAAAEVSEAAAGAGARILADLSFIDAVGVELDASALASLLDRPDVVGVTLNRDAEFFGKGDKGGKGGKGGGVVDLPLLPTVDSWFDETINADGLRSQGIDGAGVGIAILDSGVAQHPTLGGRVRPGVDLSGEGNGIDGHGHGTFLAGLAAGDGASSPDGAWGGVAPGAHIIPVKIGGQNGVSLIALLQGLQWIHFHRDTHDIDVVNMSFGTRSPQSFTVDPLNFAVQQLWADGIVVVVAAGNLGQGGARTITKPGDDPFVITVGSSDSMGTLTTADDVIPGFSSRGPTLADGIAKPDIVAPGRSVVGPIAPGSAVAAMTDAHIADGWVRASGTSMSTAVVSGAVALLLQANPTWTPGQVKGALMASAVPGPVGDPNVDGRGIVDVAAAAAVRRPKDPNAGIPFGTGLGSLEDTLGDVSSELWRSTQVLPKTVTRTVETLTCILGICVTELIEVIVPASDLEFFDEATFLSDFGVASWADTQWTGNQWYDQQWYGNQWYGNQWYGNQWYGNQWYGNQWYDQAWMGNQWYGNQWYGNQFSGNQWYGNQWYGNQWYANQWYGETWQ